MTAPDLADMYRLRFGDPDRTGPVPRLWHRWGYSAPDMYYEAAVAKLIDERSAWLDVGCGRCSFPENKSLAKMLAARCRTLVGVDPDPAIEENPFVHVRSQAPIEEFVSDEPFDVVTMRMVAEHITCPDAVVAALARLTKPGGRVVILTINRWSPVSLAAWAVPFKLHHGIKYFLWRTREKDTFPVAYKMNTRKDLRRLFLGHGFREAEFAYIPDCRPLYRFRLLHRLELSLWWVMDRLHLTYPENCLLAIYERT